MKLAHSGSEMAGGHRRNLSPKKGVKMHLLLTVLGILVVLPVAAAAIWIGYSALFVSHRVPLPPALSGDRRDLTSKAGPLSYYYSGPAAISEPMLLIHSVNAAASAYEVRPVASARRHARQTPS